MNEIKIAIFMQYSNHCTCFCTECQHYVAQYLFVHYLLKYNQHDSPINVTVTAFNVKDYLLQYILTHYLLKFNQHENVENYCRQYD